MIGQVNDPVNHPYGQMFLSTGNGSYQVGSPTVTGQPYSNPSNQYAMSVLNLDLTGGVMTVTDAFTPNDWQTRNGQDGDLGSGGPIFLPAQTTAAGTTVNAILQVGKTGTLYLLDRNNPRRFQRLVEPDSSADPNA